MLSSTDFFKEPLLIKLDQYDLIEIKGTDAREFLNNQFTNDLKALPENLSSLGAWCSIKGRVLYTFRIWYENGTFQLILPSVQTESFLKKLKMFIFRSDVTLELATDKFIYGLYGRDANQFLGSALENDNSFEKVDGNVVIRIKTPESRYLIITDNNKLELGTLSAQDEHENHWKLLDIMAGIVEILPETADMFLPQMLDLENLGGLSFQKGCYPGQEIVARVKYRGELKKQLYKARMTTNSEIKPGTSLSILENDSGSSNTLVGNIVNAASLEENTWAILAVINIAAAINSDISLQEDKETKLQLQID